MESFRMVVLGKLKDMTKSAIEIRHDYEAFAAEDAIRQLSAEIMRLVRLPYKSWKNQEAIISLDKQIEYLEELLSAYERDKKKQ